MMGNGRDILICADNSVAAKVIPPTLHVRVQVGLYEGMCPQLECAVSHQCPSVQQSPRSLFATYPDALDIVIVHLDRAPGGRGQPQGRECWFEKHGVASADTRECSKKSR